jgi:hypothetical protein
LLTNAIKSVQSESRHPVAEYRRQPDLRTYAARRSTSRKQLAAIVAGVVILAAVILLLVLAASRRAADVAVDTTALSAGATLLHWRARLLGSCARTGREPDWLNAESVAGGASANRRLGADEASPGPQPEKLSVGVPASASGGSGFPRGATVDIFLKQKVSDIVDPVTFVQADQNGKFGGVRVTVPDSVSLGTLVIQATERQGSLTAAAAATVTGRMIRSRNTGGADRRHDCDSDRRRDGEPDSRGDVESDHCRDTESYRRAECS